MTTMLERVGVCALVWLASTPGMTASAAQPAVETRQVFTAVTLADITSILDELGWSHEPGDTSESDVVVIPDDGWVFNIGTRACNLQNRPAGCLGIEMLAFWSVDGYDGAGLAEAVNRFNNANPIAKAWIGSAPDSDKAAWLARYTITDYGITRDNIRANLVGFKAAMRTFERAILTVDD